MKYNYSHRSSHVCLDFSDRFDFTTVEKQLNDFRNYRKMSGALAELQALLGEDTEHIKILSCMLKASVNIYDMYKATMTYLRIDMSELKKCALEVTF